MDAFLTNITLDTTQHFQKEKLCIIGKSNVIKTRKLILLDGWSNMLEGEDKVKRTRDAIWKDIFKVLDNGEISS